MLDVGNWMLAGVTLDGEEGFVFLVSSCIVSSLTDEVGTCLHASCHASRV
jgi:hypothetical protein